MDNSFESTLDLRFYCFIVPLRLFAKSDTSNYPAHCFILPVSSRKVMLSNREEGHCSGVNEGD